MFHLKNTVSAMCVLAIASLLTAGSPSADASSIKQSAAARPSKGTAVHADQQQASALPVWSDRAKGSAPIVPYGDGNIIYANGYSIDTRRGEPSLPSGLKCTAPKGD